MENNITQFGIYIKSNNGYVPMSLITNSSYPEFKHLAKVPSIKRNSNKIELLFYSKNFNATHFVATAKKLALKNISKEVNFNISSTDKENMFTLTTDTGVNDGWFLYIPMGWDEIAAAFLGDAEEEAIAFFSDKTLAPAYAAVQDLEDLIKVFPNNGQLSKLFSEWRIIAKQEKEVSDFMYVQEAWGQYQEAEKVILKIRYLEKLQIEINGFLSNHPESSLASDCEEFQKEIDIKFPEYNKMI